MLYFFIYAPQRRNTRVAAGKLPKDRRNAFKNRRKEDNNLLGDCKGKNTRKID